MTSSGGGFPSPQIELLSPSSPSTATPSDPSSDSRRCSSALGHRLSNVIDVHDPARIVECSQLERQRKFQYLVRRYLSQIRHGCKSAYCDTPTCLSCNKRGAAKPYRPPTELTARALAHYLASQDNPHRGLCPHELKVPPSALEAEVDIDSTSRGGSKSSVNEAQRTTRMKTQALTSIIDNRHQLKKDTKSIGQNLYDSVSVIYSYSKSIPSALSVFDLLRAPAIEGQVEKCHDGANGSPVTARTGNFTRQISRQDSRVQRQSEATREQPTVLSNGQLIHKVPYHPPVNSDQICPASNCISASADRTGDNSKMSIRKTGRKSFTLGASIPPSTARCQSAGSAAPQQAARKLHTIQNSSILSASHLNCDTLNDFKDECRRRHEHRSAHTIDGAKFTSQRSGPDEAFINQSLFYTLGDAETLLKSFHNSNDAFKCSPLPHLDSTCLAHSFRDWSQHNGALIFDSLSIAVEALLTRPLALDQRHVKDANHVSKSDQKVELASGSERTTRRRYFNNHEAAHIVMVCIHALTSSVPVAWPRTWAQLRSLRSWGVIVPSVTAISDKYADPYVNIIDAFEYEPAARLAKRLLHAIGIRNCFDHIFAALQADSSSTETDVVTPEETLSSLLTQHLVIVEQVALESKRKMGSTNTINKEPGWTVTATLAEWLKTTIIKNWDGKVEVNKWTSVGAAIMLLRQLHEHQRQLNIWSRMVRIPYLHEHMDALQDPVKFLDRRVQPNTLHVLQYAELHPTDYLVKFFRVINLTSMMSQYDHTQHIQQMLRQLDTFLREPYLYMIKHRLKVTLNDYLILDVSREQPLKDTLDQLWRQERKTLLKPLKVKLGQQEGEVGLDHGGVTYEFFRVVLGQAFAPEYGMFTIDPKTRMTWFQPGSLEPLWKFKMLGVLFSLAIYNGITLPVTFPLAFYNLMLNSRFKFLDDHTSIDYIRDGWPDLAKSFETMLDWKDGDVADVFMRDYAFSYEAFGQKIDLDMSKNDNESYSSSDTPLVTNKNRGMFVRDYVTYLILRTIRPQLKAFKKGFHTCLDSRSLELFTPKTLRQLVEGTQDISMSDLRACTTYEDYDATHPTVRMFWNIVQDFSQEDAARLLEFVTASDRVPITGYKSLTFNIVRMGGDSEQLPTSSTCFGKLYLPEYKDEGKMRRKLELAIQNAKGFGVV